MLLTAHDILPLSPVPFLPLPPLPPLLPFRVGPTEERYASFLHDHRTREEDAIAVFRLRYAQKIYVELVAEIAVSKRWARLWRVLFPPVPVSFFQANTQNPKHIKNNYFNNDISFNSLDSFSSNHHLFVRNRIVLVGWHVDTTQQNEYEEENCTSNFNLQSATDADNALVQASMFDRAEMVNWLLFRGVYLSSSNSNSNTTAVKQEDFDSSEILNQSIIYPGPDIIKNVFNLITVQGLTTALILSAKHPGSLSTLSLILNHPLSDVNAHDGSPLAWSSRMGCLEAVKLLLAHGADAKIRNGIAGLWAAGLMDIHAQEEYGLRWAVARGHLHTVQYLCKAGAMVDAMGGFSLRHAVQMGHEEIIDVLLASGADVLIASRQADVREGRNVGDTADDENALVRWAAHTGNTQLAEKLKAALLASRIRQRICLVDLEE
ncbi:hypothetical protein HK100_002827 [Physocladia obscura]|uniref:Ankyrin n=1 Tax=Physocladia obscura TaxID=109957 RepID=A0AAD5SUT9_9FUNG|nr:hypothetical protein HK100_002827 [Physocladia obscura]